ncbi:MAG: CRTAC1 family protein [Acidimicrobiales bacterium]
MTRRRRAALTVLLATTAAAVTVPLVRGRDDSPVVAHFVDDTPGSGVGHTYDGDFPFFVGGGVAVLDCNDDRRPDLFLAGGANAAALYRNESETAGALRFAPQRSSVAELDAVTGAYPLDIDGDGVLDLAVLRRGDSRILRGLGNCTFEDATARFGIDTGADWAVGFSATWEAGATLPTLAFGNYLVPGTYDCATNELLQPAGDRYAPPVELPGHCTLSLLFSDWNHDGNTGLRVSNDRNYDPGAREQLWRMRPGETPRELDEADGWRRVVIWGMGIASADLTGDGRPEVFLTSQADNKLQTLESDDGRPSYRDIAVERGVTAQRPYTGGSVLPSTAWHPEFDDVNNDGLIDLFVTKGNVEAQPDYAPFDPNNLLLGRKDGTFVETGAEAGIANKSRSRGGALVDLNLDGMLDMVVVNRRVPVEVRRNVGSGTAGAPRATGNWVALQPRGPGPNTQAVGAWVEMRVDGRTQTREVTVGGGHASGEAGALHFGIGTATSAEVRITRPGAAPGPWMTVGANAAYDLEEGASEPARWGPGG